MSSRAPAKQGKTTKPRQKMQGHTESVSGIICLPDKRRIITCSWDESLRVWDLEGGMQVGDTWKDEGSGEVFAMALSPDGKTVASGSEDGAVRLWDIEMGKVVQKWTGHTEMVRSICWSPEGERVASGSEDGTFRVWDVESGKTIIGPIKAGDLVYAVCYSPDGTMIATGGDNLNIWDANTGELLKTLKEFVVCLTWTSDGKTLITAGSGRMKKFNTATWTETAVLEGHSERLVSGVSLFPNERILASASYDKTAQLWDLQTNQPIGPPLHHEDMVKSAALSADGKFLATGCDDKDIYTWDVFAIIKDAGLNDLLSDNVNTVKKSGLDADATRRPPPQIDGARRLPPGFFDDFSTSRGTPSHGRRDHPTIALRRSRSSPLSWAQNFVSGMLRRSHMPPVVEVPLTAGKPRNYHARRKKATSSSRPPNPHTTQQNSGATQSNLTSSSQQPPATATASTTLPAATGTVVPAGTNSPPDITIRRAGWRARFMLWVCCLPIENAGGQH